MPLATSLWELGWWFIRKTPAVKPEESERSPPSTLVKGGRGCTGVKLQCQGCGLEETGRPQELIGWPAQVTQ